jgi:galacturan 1,4-alpha-galacturonidase
MQLPRFYLVPVTAFASPAVAGGLVVSRDQTGRSRCAVNAHGNETNDVPNILEAFEECGNSDIITFPEGQEYSIAEKLNPVVHNVRIEWGGTWKVRDDHIP